MSADEPRPAQGHRCPASAGCARVFAGWADAAGRETAFRHELAAMSCIPRALCDSSRKSRGICRFGDRLPDAVRGRSAQYGHRGDHRQDLAGAINHRPPCEGSWSFAVLCLLGAWDVLFSTCSFRTWPCTIDRNPFPRYCGTRTRQIRGFSGEGCFDGLAIRIDGIGLIAAILRMDGSDLPAFALQLHAQCRAGLPICHRYMAFLRGKRMVCKDDEDDRKRDENAQPRSPFVAFPGKMAPSPDTHLKSSMKIGGCR